MNYYPLVKLFLLSLLALPFSAKADTYTVTATGDEKNPADSEETLRDAISRANAYAGDDVIVFDSALAGEEIQTSGGFVISDNVEIDGSDAPSIEIAMTSEDTMFTVESGVNFSASELILRATNHSSSMLGIDACGNTSLSALRFSGFKGAVTGCPALSSLSIGESGFRDNEFAISIEKGDNTSNTTSSIELINNQILSSGVRVVSEDSHIDLGITELNMTGSDETIELEGNISASLKKSSFHNLKDFSISTQPHGFTPQITIKNSTFSNIANDALKLMAFRYSDVVLAHTTITENTMNDVHEWNDADLIYSEKGSVNVDHSIISNNTYNGDGFHSSNTSWTGTYSVIPKINEFGSRDVDLDSFSKLYKNVHVPFQSLASGSKNLPYHLLQEDSGLIDAGDTNASAGTDGVPVNEQRGSDRIVGAAIDPGATEFNREPVFDVEAFKQECEDQQQALEEADTPEGDIVIDLDNFVSDPDSDTIADIRLNSAVSLGFDPTTHVLSATKATLDTETIEIVMEDSTGLEGAHVLNEKTPKATSGNGSSGGGSGGGSSALLVALLTFAGIRRRRTAVTG